MDADHAGVCKFASPNDDNYEQVVFNLVKLASNALETVANKTGDPIPRACMYRYVMV
jgi:hypothetical protein